MAQFESLIRTNKVRSAVLVVLFILLYTALLFALAIGILALVLGWAKVHETATVLITLLVCHMLAVALATACYVGGPGLVLSAVGARPVLRAEDTVLYDVVEEMALAAGVEPPAVYMIDDLAMNCLATGLGPGKAAIIVTRGLRDRLSRDQLQGVVAHEMARIQSYDVFLMTEVAALVGLLVLATEAIKTLVTSEDTTPLVLGIFLVPWALPAILAAPALGRTIQLAVCRERLFMADAAAARLTRYPEALAEALEIIAADAESLGGASRAIAPLFIVQPLTSGGGRMGGEGESAWCSHPTVAARTERLRSLGNAEG